MLQRKVAAQDFLVTFNTQLLNVNLITKHVKQRHESGNSKGKDFSSQTKLDRNINAPFLLKEHSDPNFYFIFHENKCPQPEKNQQKSMDTFLTNEINTTE